MLAASRIKSQGTCMTNVDSPISLPLKSVAVSLLFSAVLGPVGMLYSTFWGAIFMIVMAIVVVPYKFVFPIILLWIISCVWSVSATERYNRRVVNKKV